MKQGVVNMMSRAEEAKKNFIEMLTENYGITEADAEKVLSVFIKHNVVKRDIVNGRYNVTHGAYLEPHVIQNAIEMA